MTTRRVVFVAAFLAAAVPAGSALGAADDTTLISRANGVGGAKGNSQSQAPSLSGDGRYVAFRTVSTNFDAVDTDGTFDGYVRDTQTGTTTLTSRATGVAGAKANDNSSPPVISDNGRYVAFHTPATNLDSADLVYGDDVYVRDLQTNTTTLVSRATGGAGAKGNSSSVAASISADGRYVAFESNATNLDPADSDTNSDVYVRDLQTNTTTLVSRATGVGGAKPGNSFGAAISADGSVVAFYCQSPNLDPDDADAQADVYVRDLGANTTTLVSRATGAGGAKSNGISQLPSASEDGRYVAFRSTATNLDSDDSDASFDVYVRDLQAKTTTLASRATGASGDKANTGASNLAIADDGRSVVFDSGSDNLSPSDPDNNGDIYVRDLQGDTTTLLSRATGAAGAKGNQNSLIPSISADGAFVAFGSGATNIDPLDTTTSFDIYRRELGAAEPPPPSAKPNTKIAKAKIDKAKGKAKFTFKATGDATSFQCALAKGAKKPKFKTCSSPQSYKRLKPKSYTFSVRAKGPAGTDATPAKKKFKIKK